MKPLKRVTLETSLKPFKSIEPAAIDETCREIFHQWAPLLEASEGVSVMLWVGDGTEIFEWKGRLGDPMPWALSIGFCNVGERGFYPTTWGSPQPRKDYIEDPPPMTFGALRDIITSLRRVGAEEFGLQVEIGATVDPGPEFVVSDFKYEKHREIFRGGPEAPFGETVGFICAYAKMAADEEAYAGFPDGITEGTSFGTFLGRQFADFGETMGYDYLWLSNGLAFSHYAWYMLGENFDGQRFGTVDYAEEQERVLSFWRDLVAEMPEWPIELRGTNYPLGTDIASAAVSFEDIYSAAPRIVNPPVNPPWGSRDLGMEVVAQLSRIAVLPEHGTYAIRHYINDPWFYTNPWWDYYNREPFDIYCPWVCARVNGSGEVERAKYMEFLTIDTEQGDLNPGTALEAIPHLRRAVKMAPDQPGPLTLVYPYSEFHRLAEETPDEVGLAYFHDLYLRSAVQNGLPLNTVISTDDLTEALSRNPGTLAQTVLVSLAPKSDWALDRQLIDWVRGGGKALLFGPLAEASEELRELLGVTLGEPVDGDIAAEVDVPEDILADGNAMPEDLVHRSTLSGGPLAEVAEGAAVRLQAEDTERAGMVIRREPEWGGGAVAWVRGSLPLHFREGWAQPIWADNVEELDSSVWMRSALGELGLRLLQRRFDAASRCVYVLVSRNDNAFVFTGHKPDATASVLMGFPDGAPILNERETRLADGLSEYALGRSYQYECRVFVKQESDSLIACKEQQHPTGTRRRMLVSGLEDATVTAYPAADAIRGETVDLRGSDEMEVAYDQTRKRVVVSKVTGNLTITW